LEPSGDGAAKDVANAAASPGAEAAAEDSAEAEEPMAFDPLVWLSERLAEQAKGPTSYYHDQIEQRIKLKLQEEDASIMEEGEEDVERNASKITPVPQSVSAPPGGGDAAAAQA